VQNETSSHGTFAQDEDEGSCGVAFGASQPSVEFQAAGGRPVALIKDLLTDWDERF